jgi:hypothetical protein
MTNHAVLLTLETRLAVLLTSGLIGCVGIHGVGTPIPDKEIEGVKSLLAHDAAHSPYPFLKVDQQVRINGYSTSNYFPGACQNIGEVGN